MLSSCLLIRFVDLADLLLPVSAQFDAFGEIFDPVQFFV
jgi:hypothetical protein